MEFLFFEEILETVRVPHPDWQRADGGEVREEKLKMVICIALYSTLKIIQEYKN
jgi:hypothetical protein